MSSDDEADPELLALLRASLGISSAPSNELSSDTGVLKSAEYIYSNAIDVSIDMWGTKCAAAAIWKTMQERGYSTQSWSQNELHPKLDQDLDEVGLVNFVFTMDLLNFSFWSDRSESERYQVEYEGRRWTGYMSLVACLRRALDEGIPITTPRYWRSEACSDEDIKNVFRSATDEQIPLLNQRIAILREAGRVLKEFDEDVHESVGSNEQNVEGDIEGGDIEDSAIVEPMPGDSDKADVVGNPDAGDTKDVISGEEKVAAEESYKSPDDASHSHPQVVKCPLKPDDRSVTSLIRQADHSTGRLVNLLARDFPAFRDEGRFEGRKVRFLKRAQIFVADLWAAFNGKGPGEFRDIGQLTMFADYRVPQMLHSLGVISLCPALDARLRRGQVLESGHSWEMQLRGCAIWAVELLRRQIVSQYPDAGEVHAVLIDFLLYDLAKEQEKRGETATSGIAIPHHRTRSIWY